MQRTRLGSSLKGLKVLWWGVGSPRAPTHLHSNQHLVLGGAEVVAFSQEDLPEGALTQLPLQHDVPALDVVNVCGDMGVSAAPGGLGGAGAGPACGLPWFNQ